MSELEVHYWLERRMARRWWRRLFCYDDYYIVSSAGTQLGPFDDAQSARVCAVAAAIVLEPTEIRTCREALRTLLDLIDSGAFMSNEMLARCREVLMREDERVAQDVAAQIAEGIE